ncbi:MAG: hypothetical protein GX751_08675 [Desulfuromonadaceae bacterium]|nr:hypothetical protein [Desulfuromonadaceae bacterium]
MFAVTTTGLAEKSEPAEGQKLRRVRLFQLPERAVCGHKPIANPNPVGNNSADTRHFHLRQVKPESTMINDPAQDLTIRWFTGSQSNQTLAAAVRWT